MPGADDRAEELAAETLYGDITDLPTVRAAVAGCDAVVLATTVCAAHSALRPLLSRTGDTFLLEDRRRHQLNACHHPH